MSEFIDPEELGRQEAEWHAKLWADQQPVRDAMAGLLDEWAESIENYLLDQGDESRYQFTQEQRLALGKVHAVIREARATLAGEQS